MACCRLGDKLLSEPMMVSLLTHKFVTRPQWVNSLWVIWWQGSGSTLFRMNQCWLIINGFFGIHMRAILQEIFMISICKMSLKITFLKLQSAPARSQSVKTKQHRLGRWHSSTFQQNVKLWPTFLSMLIEWLVYPYIELTWYNYMTFLFHCKSDVLFYNCLLYLQSCINCLFE